jgi:hypothetical protein
MKSFIKGYFKQSLSIAIDVSKNVAPPSAIGKNIFFLCKIVIFLHEIPPQKNLNAPPTNPLLT